MSGRRSRNKGARIEREIVRALQRKGDSMVDTTNHTASMPPPKEAGAPAFELESPVSPKAVRLLCRLYPHVDLADAFERLMLGSSERVR
jgi:hypothetical protein